MSRNLWAAAALLLLASLARDASAQAARSGGNANAQMLQQMQQLAAERTALQADNAKLNKQLEDLRKERDALKRSQQGTDARAKASEAALARNAAERDSADKEIQQLKDKLQELIGKFRETVQTMRDVETDRAAVKQSLTARERDLEGCLKHNAALYKLNNEVLDRLEHQSIFSQAARAEPFTRIKRTQLENLVDDYKQRAGEERLQPAAPQTQEHF